MARFVVFAKVSSSFNLPILGNNLFLGNGTILLGPDYKTLVGTILAIIIPSALFFITILVPFPMFLSAKIITAVNATIIFLLTSSFMRYYAIQIILALLAVFCLHNLGVAAVTDPGIIPRIPKWKAVRHFYDH
jgi:hypothetical protein